MTVLSERWLRTIPSLRELPMRARLVTRDIEESTLPEAAAALEHISGLSEQADPRAREVLAAILPSLGDPSRADIAAELRNEAHAAGHFALARLLRRRANQFVHDTPEPSERHPGQAVPGRARAGGKRPVED